MLAKDDGLIKGKRDLMTNPMLAKSDRHKNKPSAVVMTKAVLAKDNGRIKGKLDLMTKPMLAKSIRQLCKHQIFVRKPTRHRTSEPQVKAHSSPFRAVVSCDF